jgi:hypothetical protein
MDKILSNILTEKQIIFLHNNSGKIYLSIIVILIIVIICIILVRSIISRRNTSENFTFPNSKNVSWSRNSCLYIMPKTFEDIFKKHNIKRDDKNWNFYLPCGYDEINKEITSFPIKQDAKYFIVGNADEMVAKEYLWKNVSKYHGMKKALTMMPMSYILYDNNDLKRFDQDYDKNKIYIMKKNIQRQEGLKITRNKDEIMNGYKNGGYVVVQELLQDPYIIDGRKTNMRFYVLVVVIEEHINVYVYDDGFMYYTKDKFVKNSLDVGPNITTGYIERSVYAKNPLTHKDLAVYLDQHEKPIEDKPISETVFNRIYSLLAEVFSSYVGKLTTDKLHKNITFQLFGIDIAFNDKFDPVIIEINKGPDMDAKDKRDSELKHKVAEDLLITVGIIDQMNVKRKNGFLKILDV